MIDLDHRLVVVGGLVLSCLIYQVPLYTICFVILCGFAVYVRNKYNDGWRFALFGGGGNGFGFIRQIRRGRYRHANTSSAHFSLTSTSRSEQDLRQRTDELSINSNSGYGPLSSRRSSPNFSFNSTPKCRLDLKNYDVSPRLHKQNPSSFHSKLLSPSFPSDMGRPRHRTSVYDVPNINNQGRMDSTFDEPVETTRPKYSGVGVYPFVQLEPRRPALLSHCNSTMVKNRVTVKVALPERQNSNQNLNRSSPKVSFSSSSSQECGTVVEALNTRKRPLKDDGGNNMEHSATKRRHHQSENDQNVPHLPSEITQHFESQLSDESLAILSQPMETTVEDQDETVPSTIGRAKTNAIHSSYSSSVRFERSVTSKRTKRKPESICEETPEVKFGRSHSPNREDRRTPVEQNDVSEAESSEVRTSDDLTEIEPSKSEEKVTGYSFHATMTGARNPMPVHVPTYIPSMEDYLEDKKAEEERLKKILGSFTVVNTNKNKEESSSISIVPISTVADSQTVATTPATKDTVSVTQPDNLNNVPSVTGTTSESSTSLPTSSLFVTPKTTTTEVENVPSAMSEALSVPPPPSQINFPFVPTTVLDKQNSESPFNNSITSSFNVTQQPQTVSSEIKNDPITTTYPLSNPLEITSTQPSVNVNNTLTASPFATSSTAPFSFGTMSQNTSTVATSLQFKAPEPLEQQKISSSPFTFGAKPLNSNTVTVAEATKPSSIGSGGFSFPISNPVSTAVSAATSSGPSSIFSNVSSPFGSNQIVTTTAVATATMTSESSNLNNVSQFNSVGGNKPISSFGGGGFTFGQNFNPPKTESSTNGGQSNSSASYSSALQFGSSSLQNSNPFGHVAPTTSLVIPTFGTATTSTVPTFGITKSTTIQTFGTTTTSGSVPMFGTATTTALPTFGAATSATMPLFGTTTPKAVPTFGTATTTAMPTFGSGTTTAIPTFGTSTSSMAVPTFGTVRTAFGSTVATNGTNINGDTTNGGQFGVGQPFSFGTSNQNNQTNNSGVFTFGGANPSSNNNSNSFVGSTNAPQSFDFSSSSKPSFNFGSSTPAPSPISGTSAQTPNTNMFSVTPSNSNSARRSKHPPQRHRYHR